MKTLLSFAPTFEAYTLQLLARPHPYPYPYPYPEERP